MPVPHRYPGNASGVLRRVRRSVGYFPNSGGTTDILFALSRLLTSRPGAFFAVCGNRPARPNTKEEPNMKLDKLVGERFRERPAGCVIESHALMVRGGYTVSYTHLTLPTN